MTKHIKPASIVDFTQYKKTANKTKDKILSLDVYKEEGNINFSYVMLKHGKRRKSDDFIAYCLLCAITDIMEYNEDPANILELAEEMTMRLGYEVNGEDGDE